MKKFHRVFIAINLPLEIKEKLANYRKKWLNLPAKWVPKENLHITIMFLGNVTNQELGEICLKVKEIAKNHQPINIVLNKIAYGPINKLPPRYLWVIGQKSSELFSIKQKIESFLLEKTKRNLNNKSFNIHITLARIRAWQWQKIETEERPEISEDINIIFTAESLEIMESEIKKGGPQYTIIESQNFQ